MGFAETMLAAWAILRPTPPTPKITTDCPILIFASLFTTPKAVVTEQPKSGASFKSKSLSIGVSLFSDTIAFSLKVVTFPALSFFPFHL